MRLFVPGILEMMLKAEYLIILWFVNIWWNVNGNGDTVCGLPPKYMNNKTHECVDGIIKPRTTTTTTTTPSPPQSMTNMPQTPLPCRDSYITGDVVLKCSSKVYYCPSDGYKCCAFGSYLPQYQTCCRETSASYKIHDNMPEKEYICCGLQTYKRGSPEVPCQHPSLNDRLFHKLVSSKQLLDCKDNLYAFSLVITGQTNSTAVNRKLYAQLSIWSWNPTFRRQPTQEKDMEIPLDIYSPGKKKQLTGKRFLLFSNYSYHKDVVFFLNTYDEIYKGPKNPEKIVKRLEKIKENVLTG